MSSKLDYYQTLGIGKNASQEEIKQAYRKLAREHHPDMVKDGDKESAEKRFKEINEAYQVLSDPQKRKMYDQYGSAGVGANGFNQNAGGQWGPFTYTYSSGGNGTGYGFGDFDPFDVFEDFFGFRGFGGASKQPKKGKSLYYELTVEFSDAVFGSEKEINIESGKVKIKIPSGVRDGTELRFAGKGMPGPANTPNGDLFISIRVLKPKEFDVIGDTLYIKKEIKFTEAILGAAIEVTVVDMHSKTGLGVSKLKIPSGTQHGTRFVIRGKGLPKLNSRGQGDVLVEVVVKIPEKVNSKQKDLLEQLSETL